MFTTDLLLLSTSPTPPEGCKGLELHYLLKSLSRIYVCADVYVWMNVFIVHGIQKDRERTQNFRDYELGRNTSKWTRLGLNIRTRNRKIKSLVSR
jgi:hypothetical protein